MKISLTIICIGALFISSLNAQDVEVALQNKNYFSSIDKVIAVPFVFENMSKDEITVQWKWQWKIID